MILDIIDTTNLCGRLRIALRGHRDVLEYHSEIEHFQNIHTFTYQKTLLHTIFVLAFKIVESFQCVLN